MKQCHVQSDDHTYCEALQEDIIEKTEEDNFCNSDSLIAKSD